MAKDTVPDSRNFWRNRRRYLENPSHLHPKFGTPLEEPYQRSTKSVTVTTGGKKTAIPARTGEDGPGAAQETLRWPDEDQPDKGMA
ncbi:MAG: hypothetical protein GX442_22675 [Candidatus Riflebacteria bacterium]|nr:hypothetical protein [Candidatus Riflebacteria bacterium]